MNGKTATRTLILFCLLHWSKSCCQLECQLAAWTYLKTAFKLELLDSVQTNKKSLALTTGGDLLLIRKDRCTLSQAAWRLNQCCSLLYLASGYLHHLGATPNFLHWTEIPQENNSPLVSDSFYPAKTRYQSYHGWKNTDHLGYWGSPVIVRSSSQKPTLFPSLGCWAATFLGETLFSDL